MPSFHHEHDTTPTSCGTTSTSTAPSREDARTNTPAATEAATASARIGHVGEDNNNLPDEEEVQPSFLFRALSQAANSIWSFSFRPTPPTPPSPTSSQNTGTDSTATSSQRLYSTPDAGDDGDIRGQLSPEGRLIPSELLSAVLNGTQLRGGTSRRVILEAGPEPSSEDNDSNSDGCGDGDGDDCLFSAQIRQIETARAELHESLSAGIARHSRISTDIERATRALTVRSLELDNRALELDTRESQCELRESRLGIDWVARTRRICERERAAAATAAELSARFAALETRQQKQDEILSAERDHFWDIQKALSQVIANETEELLVEQKKLREDFEAKSIAAKNALLKMHNAVRLCANTILKGPNGNANNGNCIPKYLRDAALETRRQIDNANGMTAPNGSVWASDVSLVPNGREGHARHGQHPPGIGMTMPERFAGASVATNGISREGDSCRAVKRVSDGGMRDVGNSQSGRNEGGYSERRLGRTRRIGGSDRTEPG